MGKKSPSHTFFTCTFFCHSTVSLVRIGGNSSSGKSLILHSRGTWFDTRALQFLACISLTTCSLSAGGLAQVVERSICIREAPGSIPGFSSFQNIVATVAKGVLVIPRQNSIRNRFITTCGFDFWHLKMCRDPGLNQGPSDLQSDALPTELSRLI